MKRIFKIFTILSVLSIAACTDFVDPAIPYSSFETGVYLRTLSVTSNVNFFALASSKFDLSVEAVDEEDGKLVQEVDVFVSRRRGQMVLPEAKILTVPASAFQPHTVVLEGIHPAAGSKYPAANISITIPEALTALGLTLDDITGGDFFEFRLVLRDTKGRTFTNTNLSGDVSGGQAFRSPFFYRVPVVCPSTLGGEYTLSTATPNWCSNTYEGKVRFVAGTTPATATTYSIFVDLDGTFVEDFSFGAYRACYGANTAPPTGGSGLRMTDACGAIAFNSSPSAPWGDNFFIENITVTGPVLVLEFKTSWESESGTATITRTDGTNWPPLRK